MFLKGFYSVFFILMICCVCFIFVIDNNALDEFIKKSYFYFETNTDDEILKLSPGQTSSENLSEAIILNQIQFNILNGLLNGTEAKINALQLISSLVLNTLHSLEVVENCNTTITLYCELPHHHGFGHQVLQRLLCVLLSYNLQLPVILGKGKWPYSQDWNDVFIPTGSNCSAGPNTIRFDWRHQGRLIGDRKVLGKLPGCNNNCKFIEFPFNKTSPIPSNIEPILKYLQPKNNGFDWWIGQFTKYLLQLNSDGKELVENGKESLGFNNLSRPMIGMHIRRTDKKWEANYVSTKNYFKEIEIQISNGSNNFVLQNLKNPLNVFIATDDPRQVLREAKYYTNTSKLQWNIVGFENITSTSVKNRYTALDEIIRDIFMLVDCDFVVCTLSSNVCKAVWVMMSAKYYDISKHIVSLDWKDYYLHLCNGLKIKLPE